MQMHSCQWCMWVVQYYSPIQCIFMMCEAWVIRIWRESERNRNKIYQWQISNIVKTLKTRIEWHLWIWRLRIFSVFILSSLPIDTFWLNSPNGRRQNVQKFYACDRSWHKLYIHMFFSSFLSSFSVIISFLNLMLDGMLPYRISIFQLAQRTFTQYLKYRNFHSLYSTIRRGAKVELLLAYLYLYYHIDYRL